MGKDIFFQKHVNGKVRILEFNVSGYADVLALWIRSDGGDTKDKYSIDISETVLISGILKN